MRKLQIGVTGSMADLGYSRRIVRLAEALGKAVAKSGAVLLFGAEKDSDSLSTAAARGAKSVGGMTVGITYGKGLRIYEPDIADIMIASGSERGGGRELPLALSCDAIICLGGGSGTLTEMAIAYQANIPIVVLANTGGWSQKLAGKFLDERKRVRVESARTPQEAVTRAIAFGRRTLFVAATHGNETIGVTVLKQLQRSGIVSARQWIVGNPRAFAKEKRYTMKDLNRIFPGQKMSSVYEERRAADILAYAERFENVVDIHGTDDTTGIFVIVSNPTPENLALACEFDVENIVFWPSTSGCVTGPLNQFVRCSVELECGSQKSLAVRKELQRIIREYLTGRTPRRTPKYYRVYGALKKYDDKRTLKSFRKATVAGKSFYPLLVNRYPGVVCYQMQRVRVSR